MCVYVTENVTERRLEKSMSRMSDAFDYRCFDEINIYLARGIPYCRVGYMEMSVHVCTINFESGLSSSRNDETLCKHRKSWLIHRDSFRVEFYFEGVELLEQGANFFSR